MISKDKVYAKIKKTGNLPTLPKILLRLLEACDNEATPLTEIASIISKDPALSFRALQLVNSSYYGLQSTFTGIEQAVVYLGANSIKNIAVTTAIHQVFEKKRFDTVKKFNINTFWWHSLLSATLAKRLAKKTGFSSLDEAYLSGLLHDIGRLVLISTFPKEHESILLETEDVQNELWAETQLIGITHCEAGSWLIKNWKLNSLMADAIRYHHEPLDDIKEAFPLVKIVYVCNLLSDNTLNYERNYEAGEVLLGLGATDLTEIFEGATEEVVEIAANLDIRVTPPPPPRRRPKKSTEEIEESGDGLEKEVSAQVIAAQASEDDEKAQAALTAKIKSITLLTGFLESLVQAGDVEAIVAAFEHSVSILFDIEKVLFFLPDKDGVLLRGRTSAANNLNQLSHGLTLPVRRSSSLIVKAHLESSMNYLATDDEPENLADQQILSALKSSTVLFVPIIADKKPAGIILLGLPESIKALSPSDCKLVKVIAQQVGLCLYLERMKEKKAEEIEAERMAAVSMTAKKFAHEINNPLGIISNYLMTMKLKLTEENDIKEELGIIDEEIARISAMIDQMDMFSQAAFTLSELTDVNKVIDDIVQLTKASLFDGSGTVVSFHPDDSLPRIMTSRDAIKQIMINLLKNSSEAMEDGGRVEILTRVASAKKRGVPNGIEIVVSDSGPGLPDSIKANLYKPFVTTKEGGHPGLGLSIVYKAVNELGGAITCSSKQGKGTSFVIFFPQEKE